MSMKYIGDGTHINGVPARDLTDTEEKWYAELIAEQEKATGIKLYRKSRKQAAGSKGK